MVVVGKKFLNKVKNPKTIKVDLCKKIFKVSMLKYVIKSVTKQKIWKKYFHIRHNNPNISQDWIQGKKWDN